MPPSHAELYARALLIAVLALGTATRGTAQSLVAEPVPAPGISAFTFASPSMGETYEVIVGTVFGNGASGSRRYPALIVTDGYGQFETAHAAARSLVSSGAVEPMLVIGIGAPVVQGDDARDRRRVYEFSPPGWAMTDAFGQSVTLFCARMHSAAGRCTGGAPAFLGMIVHELLPRLVERLPIDTTRLGLYGLSAGGFFAAWVMFQEMSPFHKYIISSPALAYGDGEIFRQETRWATSHKDLRVGVFMAAGTLEMDDAQYELLGQIGSGPLRLSAALKQRHYPGLRLLTEILPGLGHGDGAGTALVRGLRTLYARDSGATAR